MELTIWERVQLVGMLSAERGSVGHIRQCIQLMDKIEPTDEEKKKIKFVKNDEVAFWAEELLVNIEFSDEEVNFLTDAVDRFNSWPTDSRVLVLADKFSKGED